MDMESIYPASYYYYENYTNEPFETICDRNDDNFLGAQLSVLFYFMFVLSFLGNGLVLVIIHRFEKLTTVTNILLLNLVLSSLIFMSSLPFLGAYMQLSDWIFGRVMCKLTSSVYFLGFYSSVLFLALLTFDRHLAVVYSLDASRLRSRRYAVLSCGVVWLVSALACFRPMIVHTTHFSPLDDKTFCEELYDEYWENYADQLRVSGFYLHLCLFVIFPLVVIIYCYVRIAVTVLSSKLATKFKTVRLIFFIVLLFFLCWTPFNIVSLIHESEAILSCEESKRLGYALQATRTLAYAYFCISPIFYTFVGKKFQNYVRQMLVQRFPKLKRHVAVSQQNGTNGSTKTTPTELRL